MRPIIGFDQGAAEALVRAVRREARDYRNEAARHAWPQMVRDTTMGYLDVRNLQRDSLLRYTAKLQIYDASAGTWSDGPDALLTQNDSLLLGYDRYLAKLSGLDAATGTLVWETDAISWRWARITAYDGATGRYAWRHLHEVAPPTLWEDHADGQHGDFSGADGKQPAYEINAQAVAVGTHVQLWPTTLDWRFQSCCSPGSRGSSGGSGGKVHTACGDANSTLFVSVSAPAGCCYDGGVAQLVYNSGVAGQWSAINNVGPCGGNNAIGIAALCDGTTWKLFVTCGANPGVYLTPSGGQNSPFAWTYGYTPNLGEGCEGGGCTGLWTLTLTE